MVVVSLQNEQFYNLAKFMDIVGTFFESTADCKMEFSLMDAIKNKIRNRSGACPRDMLLSKQKATNHM